MKISRKKNLLKTIYEQLKVPIYIISELIFAIRLSKMPFSEEEMKIICKDKGFEEACDYFSKLFIINHNNFISSHLPEVDSIVNYLWTNYQPSKEQILYLKNNNDYTLFDVIYHKFYKKIL